ncbi:2,3-bisphosphoglycerate-independent phosphoglycerate mutase [Campylobacter helveticus]|uniref:2,3-bisphosphoglycerate-independent phosphoglycerate mutase n=1 Tax=Campylobacter helveticus TaxID=28898 RepID=A0ABY3L4S3_9BACT|nr:2,3-bisphosphoglycerate-independent phosphoglycerate mutase [Campylobacter helveticus]MCR2039060.1 2,3-bisphosphoglycerate-independent phosphoglycerate mutase [Campylobacter helveticus]MCR2057237.1 2,3-bisphosphoglycerate-independent phosphoglycerate mutase [Campylobacter helveticus]MCR2066651.1 2,3-bisphosphoglycerate-independent phosphoglycerate mutase [Campylobacter helveticus]TNB55837.1 2,3-bisphosphoglycerate-independent phosphoglycerate mutase [Campylobacter helveticus]TNH34339.1 2,3-
MKQKCILIITDGIGHNLSSKFNAFNAAKKPNYEKFFKEVPNALLKTSGLAVGLPEGQMGNSEVGHMCIGSGRIIYQNLVKINKAIENNTLKDNANLKALLNKCKRVHIIGLYSDGGVHSLHTHFNALLAICKNEGREVFAHAISDGRDVSPKSGLNFIKDLENFCEAKGVHLASLSGRFYAMDRDKRWERVEAYYKALLGQAKRVQKMSAYVEENYQKDVFDEFIEPVISEEFDGLNEDDGLIFINFRNDRMKQLVELLSAENFTALKQEKRFAKLLTMSVYDDKFNIPVLFEKEELKNTLAEVISNANLTQLHTAETEKYAHVTFFFNGGKEDLLENETRVLIPSPKIKTYDEKPQMSAFEVCEVVKEGIKKGEDFIVVNFANGDMVGHTGNFNAAVKAVEAVDKCLGQIVDEARKQGYAFIITSDHGNCEAMQDENGNLLTNHTTFDVFVFIEAQICKQIKQNMGLSNIASSVLKILDLEIPKEMNEALF